MNDKEFLEHMQSYNEEHEPDGYPCVKMSDINRLLDIIEKKKRFVKPAIQEIEIYCVDRNNKVDPQKFYDHYESNGWMVGKTHMKNWQAAVRTWEKNSYGLQVTGQRGRTTADIREEARNQTDSIVRAKLGISNGSDKSLGSKVPYQSIGHGERTVDKGIITCVGSEVIEGCE